jgi:hypothetical protein
VAKPEEKGPFRRPWKGGTEMGIKEIMWDGMTLHNLAQDIEE